MHPKNVNSHLFIIFDMDASPAAPAPGPSIPAKRSRLPRLSKHLLVTVFNADFTLDDPLSSHWDDTRMEYWIYQHEKAATTGRDHLQVYVCFKTQLRINQVQTYLGDPTCHIESKKGTVKEAIDYCSKADTRVKGPWSRGTVPVEQGHRSDLDSIVEGMKDGSLKNPMDVARNYPKHFILHHAGIQALFALAAPHRDRNAEAEVYVNFGVAGSGKSHSSRDHLETHYSADQIYEYNPGMKGYFQRYMGQKGVLFDEIGGFTLNDLKVLLHPGDTTVNVKYGDYPWLAEMICINSNHSPDDWYWKTLQNDSQASLPLWRIFKAVMVWDHPYVPDDPNPRFREFVRDPTDTGGVKLRQDVMTYWGDVREKLGLTRYETHACD